MNLLNNLSITPDQHIVAIPTDFCYNDFGMNNPNIPAEAIRLSRVINKLTNAFRENDTILSGFNVSNFKYKYKNIGGQKISEMRFNISEGEAIIDNTFIKLPYKIDCYIQDVDRKIPISQPTGRLLITIQFNFSDKNHPDRPIRQDHIHNIINYYPLEQVSFNPYIINYSLYNDVTKELIVDGWNSTDHVILITAQIYYKRNELNPSEYIFWFNDASKNSEIPIICDDDVEKIYQEQGGGFTTFINIIDGGDLDKASEVIIPPVGIKSIYNMEVESLTNEITDVNVSSENNLYVFYNGILYSQASNDYTYINNTINFLVPKILSKDSVIQIFETQIQSNPNLGYLKTIYRGIISQSNVDFSKNTILIDSLDPDKKYIIFYNGIAYSDNIDYIIEKNKIIFRNHIQLNINISLNIIEIINGTNDDAFIKLIYDDIIINTGKRQSVFGLNPEKAYLVWYNGILYRHSSDYIISENNIEFRRTELKSGNSLKIIQV